MNGEKTTLPSLRNVEWKTVKKETNKINQVIPYISTNNITELNELIYAGVKLVWERIGILSKIKKKKSKPAREIRLETQIKYLRKQAKMIKQRKNAGTSRNKKEMATQEKNNSTTWGNKPENTGDGRNLKEISTKGKTIQTKAEIPRQRKKILPTSERRWHKTYQQPDAKETERFWTKIWQPKNITKKPNGKTIWQKN